MTARIEDSPLYKMVNPRSLAFFGASNNPTAMGSIILSALMKSGYPGQVFPVHPKEETVKDLPAFRSVLDLPETPDLAVLVLPTRIVCQTIDECGRKGIRHAVVVSGGFKEVGGGGVALEKELVETAARHGIRLFGPNCLGVANLHGRLNTTPFPFTGRPGFIGLASQSGSFVTQMFNYLDQLGLGFSTALSVGNEANVDLVDCLEYLGACPDTRVIALYIEGLRRGREFVEKARAISARKPIVAFYIGGSDAGRKAGFSHTGSMAGPDRLYDGIFRQSGVIRARSLTEMFDFCWVLGSQPLPRGRNLVIQTHSGGPGAAAADACGRAGLKLPELSPETIEGLKPYIPHTASVGNPVDLTFTRNPLEYTSDIPGVLIQEKNADMQLIYLLMPTEMVIQPLMQMGLTEQQAMAEADKLVDSQAEAMAGILKKNTKPAVGFTYRKLDERFVRGLVERGIPVFAGEERAARALAALAAYKELQEKIAARQA